MDHIKYKYIIFTPLQAANHDFYITQRNQCCRDLERIEFPVFQASTVESHPARISPIPTPLPSDIDEKLKENGFSSSSHGNNLSKPELSEGKCLYDFIYVVIILYESLRRQYG